MTGIADLDAAPIARAKINSVLVTEFETMAELLADTAMTYSAGQANTVAAGRSIVTRKEGFRFEVRPVGATDNTSTTAGGVLIKALPDAAGAYNWVQLGGNGDGVTDNLPVKANIEKVFPQRAFNSYPGGMIEVPEGVFYFSDMFVISRPIHLRGKSSGQVDFPPFSFSATVFRFAGGKHGIRLAGTLGDFIPEGTASHTILENLCIRAATRTGFVHGVWASCRFTAMNVAVLNFGGDGWHISATAPATGNANLFCMFRCGAEDNGRHGLYVEGADANAGQVMDFNAYQNVGWGIYDSSFLGNHYFGIHTAVNNLGPVRTDNPNAPSVFVGLYSESDQGPSVFAAPATFLGGLQASGYTGVGNAITRPDRVVADQQLGHQCGIYQISLTNPGSGYTSSPTVTVSPPTGGIQATATATVHDGRITSIAMTNRGLGYSFPPTVTIADASGTGATATAVIKPAIGQGVAEGSVAVILLDNEGSGYVNPTVTISPPTTVTATAGAVVNTATGQVERIIVTNPGQGYHNTPTVTLTGGGGTGATATAIVGGVGRNGVSQVVEVGGGDVFRITRTGMNGEPTMRLRYRAGASGNIGNTNDLIWNENNLDGAETFQIIGTKTAFSGGRRTTQPLVVNFVRGIVLNGLRNISFSSTIPPTSGEYARGDIIFGTDASPSASPGVHCTTTGLAGSTAVFKTIANLGA